MSQPEARKLHFMIFSFLFLLIPLQGFAEGQLSAKPADSSNSTLTTTEKKLERTRALMSEGLHLGEPRLSAAPEAVASGFSMIQGLGICIGVFLIGVAIYKKYTGATSLRGGRLSRGRRLRVVERLSVSSRTALIMAEVDGKPILFTVGPDKVSFGPAVTGLTIDEIAAAGGFASDANTVASAEEQHS